MDAKDLEIGYVQRDPTGSMVLCFVLSMVA